MSDQTCTKTFEGRYKPYGGDLSSTGSRGSFGWVGTWGYRQSGLPDSSTYIRARHYSIVSGRWTTVDPMWPRESSLGYVDARVAKHVDPSGLQKRYTDVIPYHEHFIDPFLDSLFDQKRYEPCREDMPPTIRAYFYSDFGGPYPYWHYGNYCGYDYFGQSGPPINDLDEACKEHDSCLATWPKIIYLLGCNDKLCNDIRYIWNNQCVKSPYDIRKCRAIYEMSSLCPPWHFDAPDWPPGKPW